jgi:hypothetical protein
VTTRRKNREGVQDQLRTALRRARTLVEGMEPAAITRRPGPDSWSVAECLDHLNETARLYLPEFAETIDRSRKEGRLARPGSSDRTLFGRFVVWTQEPPVRFRMKTLEGIRPRGEEDPVALLDTFEALHEELIVRINEASDLDRRRIRMRSVLDRRLKLSLGDWFHFMAAHVRRHLWQAERVRDELAGAGDSAEG